MPRFYFDVDDGDKLYRDEIGSELASVQAARDEASRAVAELARDYLPSADPQKNITMWVRNEDGSALLSLSLSFAVQALDGSS